MNARSLVTTGGIFMAANLAAGLLNYFFQVMASRQLNASDFSLMSSWIAHVTVFFILAGILQYSSNFLPTSARNFRLSLVLINCAFGGLAASWFLLAPGLNVGKASLMVIGSTLFAWVVGQIQSRLLFFAVAAANLLIGLSKNAIVYAPVPLSDVEKFAFAFFACNLPALWLITITSWRKAQPPARPATQHSSRDGLLAAGLLSAYSILIPQIDLILLDWTQTRGDFNDMARASVFYKAIYFFFFAIAQFLLPIQLKSSHRAVNPWFGSLRLGALAFVACGTLALISPWINQNFLRWDSEPGRDLIFLSCLNMTILTWVFMLAQEACARKQIRVAALGLGLLFVEWALQWLLAVPTASYFALALPSRFIILVILHRGLTHATENSTGPL